MLRNLSNASFFKRGPNFDAEFEQARILSIHHEKLKNIAERTSHAKELGIEPSNSRNPKKEKILEQKYREIDGENQKLLGKLTTMSASIDNINQNSISSSNRIKRPRRFEEERIRIENMKLANRIVSIPPHINHAELDEFSKSYNYHRRRLCAFGGSNSNSELEKDDSLSNSKSATWSLNSKFRPDVEIVKDKPMWNSFSVPEKTFLKRKAKVIPVEVKPRYKDPNRRASTYWKAELRPEVVDSSKPIWKKASDPIIPEANKKTSSLETTEKYHTDYSGRGSYVWKSALRPDSYFNKPAWNSFAIPESNFIKVDMNNSTSPTINEETEFETNINMKPVRSNSDSNLVLTKANVYVNSFKEPPNSQLPRLNIQSSQRQVPIPVRHSPTRSPTSKNRFSNIMRLPDLIELLKGETLDFKSGHETPSYSNSKDLSQSEIKSKQVAPNEKRLTFRRSILEPLRAQNRNTVLQ